MKITILIMTMFILHVSAVTKAQITLVAKKELMRSVLKSISIQSGYDFVYTDQDLNHANPVNLKLNNVSLEEALKACFENQPLVYQVADQTVMVKIKSPSFLDKVKSAFTIPILVTGRVTDSIGVPLPGASVKVKDKITKTDSEGKFSISAEAGTLVTVSFVGYKSFSFSAGEGMGFQNVMLKSVAGELQEVIVNTGYQSLPKERATGSFSFVDNKTLNRVVGPDILSRLEGVTSGLLFDPNASAAYGGGSGSLNIAIRGRSTILSNTDPLIVYDNFPYDGDLNNINPNDIESVTVLKDAAAASIWGAKAANGVIVITSKKGKYNQLNNISFSSNFKISNKPNLAYSQILTGKDYLQIEKYLFQNGYYDSAISDPYHSQSFTPAVYDLIANRDGLINDSQLQNKLNSLGNQDVRKDFSKYLYQKSFAQQYNLNISGGNSTEKYFISGGYDRGISNVKNRDNNRITLNFNNTYSILKDKLELSTNFIFTKEKSYNNGIDPSSINYNGAIIYPYAQLADINGKHLPIQKYISPLIDTLGQGKLLNWNYVPLDEQNTANNVVTNFDYKLNLGLTYHIVKYLNATFNYQFSKGEQAANNLYSNDSYYTRDFINQFTTINYNDGTITRAVPLGAILEKIGNLYSGQHGRFQLNFDQDFGKHQLVGFVGAEINDISTNIQSSRYYGYNDAQASLIPVDYVSSFTNLITGFGQQIPDYDNLTVLSDRFVSFFGNMAYTYANRYSISLSGRKDGANIFGVNTNQKVSPFWSAGLSWRIDDEPIYHLDWLPLLKLRITYGYNGNVNRGISALLTTQTDDVNRYQQPASVVTNAPNPNLRWETSKQLNFGLDYSILKNNRIYGSFDFYHKRGINLIGDAILPPSSGFTSYRGNTADMTGSGLDVIINAKIINGKFKWQTSLQMSIAKNKVTAYKVDPVNNSSIVGGTTPVVGFPVAALFSYPWAGLDPANGDPQGYLNGKISKDYTAIINSVNRNDIIYNGSQQPTKFGNFMNTISWRQISLSANILYKFGYFFRKPSISYSSVFYGNSLGNIDYEKRWQKPGDETSTNVPSMTYPADGNRDAFYAQSSTLIDKGDQIRLKDIRASFDVDKNNFKSFPFAHMQIYIVLENLGIIWKANKDNIDPDKVPSGFSYITPMTISAGLKIDL